MCKSCKSRAKKCIAVAKKSKQKVNKLLNQFSNHAISHDDGDDDDDDRVARSKSLKEIVLTGRMKSESCFVHYFDELHAGLQCLIKMIFIEKIKQVIKLNSFQRHH